MLKNIITYKTIFIGSLNYLSVHPREIFKEAIIRSSASIILVHNHPAGSIIPSYEDVYLTNEFIKLGRMMGIFVIDHLIIGKNNYYSMRESNGDLFGLEEGNLS